MHAFSDALARTWEISINVATVRRVRALTGVDLPGLFGDEMRGLAALLSDPVKLVDVLWVLIGRQAVAAAVNEESFAEGLLGDTLRAATEAFLEELVDFFPEAGRRAALREVLAKGKEVAAALTTRARQTVQSLSPQQIADLLASRSKLLSGPAPASSAFTPDAGHSAS